MADPVIRLDKSKTFSTCHGDRTPEDPAYKVAYNQGGVLTVKGRKVQVLLPFDVHGELVPDDGKTGPFRGMGPEGKEIVYQPLYDANMRAYLAAKIARMTAIASVSAPAAGPQIEDEGDGSISDELAAAPNADDVDLSAWLRGQAKYPPRLLREAALKRFSTHYSSTADIVVDAVMDHKLVREDEVCQELAGYLKKAFVSDPSIHTVAANAPVGTGSRDPAFNAQMPNEQQPA